jgi:hypothetical protein
MNILYFLNNILVVMTIWKWLLAQTIMDGYSLTQFLVFLNESNIPIVIEEGEIGVEEAIYFSEEEVNCWTF